MNNVIDHVAVVVKSIEAACARLNVDARAEAIESFPREGTRELYVGDSPQSGRLLLMQPTSPGPYQRALEKRGEGLHHVAFRVDDVHEYIDAVAPAGWLLHPRSLREFASSGTAWLCRPGVQCLFEVLDNVGCTHNAAATTADKLVSHVEIPVLRGQAALVAALGVTGLTGVATNTAMMTFRGERVTAG